jgi:hypothetical protein
MDNLKKKRFLIPFLILLSGISFYFASSHKRSSIKIPVLFTVHPYHPLIHSEIQGKKIDLLVDSGACEHLYISKEILGQVRKSEEIGHVKIHDLRGNSYDWKIHSVQDIKIGSLDLLNYDVVEETPDFHEHTGLGSSLRDSSSQDSGGRVGWRFFENHATLFDFPNSSIHMAKKMDDLKGEGLFKQKGFIAVPFAIQDGAIVLTIKTDLGSHKMILDTGSTYCILSRSKVDVANIRYYSSSKLLINGCDFGDWEFALTDITDLINIDGVLGADFFLEHAVCFDFANQTAYIQKPGGYMATQWKRGKYHFTQFLLRQKRRIYD